MISWPEAFALTLTLETAVLLVFFWHRAPRWRIVLTALVANAVTHPVVWFVLPKLMTSYGAYIVVAETWAVLAEVPILVAMLRPRPWYVALSASALANLASYGCGLLLQLAD